MRKRYTGWIALAGAASVAGAAAFGAPAALAAEDRSGRPEIGQPTRLFASYMLDGFEVGYLPPGLDGLGISARSSTDLGGNRVSQVSWVAGAGEVAGKVAVLRHARLADLDDLRTAEFPHLDTATLETVKNNGRTAYLSRATGELFWVEEPGVAIGVHLRPENGTQDQLTAMAAGIRPRQGEAELPAIWPLTLLPRPATPPKPSTPAPAAPSPAPVTTAPQDGADPAPAAPTAEPEAAPESAAESVAPADGAEPAPAEPVRPTPAASEPAATQSGQDGQAPAEQPAQTPPDPLATPRPDPDAPATAEQPAAARSAAARTPSAPAGTATADDRDAVRRCLVAHITAPGGTGAVDVAGEPAPAAAAAPAGPAPAAEPARHPATASRTDAVALCAGQLGVPAEQVEDLVVTLTPAPVVEQVLGMVRVGRETTSGATADPAATPNGGQRRLPGLLPWG
ncbi:hypothetical protein [Marinactinospora rubrisoli]|uniref:Uncharacterized protein n=1 Tax=Marinactinospora rubrisoli TaxID=2715399 RepID=A0ABW2KIR8_9ACTN